MRASQVPGPPSSCVPWSNTPPGVARSSPYHGAATVAFEKDNTLGTRNQVVFVAAYPTAHTLACLRFAGAVYRHRRKARYRPGRAHPWPGGFRTRWTTNGISSSHRILDSFPTILTWSHYPAYRLGSSDDEN